MKDTKPFLTIAVPTYNAPSDFETTLDSIVPQLLPGVDILVRDDSADDRTEKIARKYISNGVPISYVRGEKIGLDAADFWLLENSRGTYVWWFGNDTMAPGAITRVLNILREHQEITLMWVNSVDRNSTRPVINIGPSRFFNDGEEALVLLSDMWNFISALIFHREEALFALPVARPFNGTWLGGFCVPLELLAHNKSRIYYLAEPYVIGKPHVIDEPLWYDEFQVYAMDYPVVLRSFKGKFKKRIIRKVIKQKWNAVCRAIIVHRAKGYYQRYGSVELGWEIFIKLLYRYWSFASFWWLMLLLLFPRKVISRLYQAYLWISKK